MITVWPRLSPSGSRLPIRLPVSSPVSPSLSLSDVSRLLFDDGFLFVFFLCSLNGQKHQVDDL